MVDDVEDREMQDIAAESLVLEVSVDAIVISPYQPRRHFGEKELQELADSIRSVGIIHPPVVRPVGDCDGDG